jgi:ABC-type multidrug transport system ATPase subunit
VVIFQDLALKVERGSTVAVLGHRHAGKTLLLRAAAGLTTSDAGKILVDGVPVSKPAAVRKVGFMPRPPGRPGAGQTRVLPRLAASGGVFPHTTVREDLEFFAACQRIDRRDRSRLIGDVLALTDLENCTEERTDRLGFGRQAKLFFARAILHNPDLLLLDDPCPAFSANLPEFWEILGALKGMGKGILLTGTDPAEFRDGPDRLAVLYGGRILDDGRPAEVLERLAKAGWPPPPMIFGGLAVRRPPPRPRAPPWPATAPVGPAAGSAPPAAPAPSGQPAIPPLGPEAAALPAPTAPAPAPPAGGTSEGSGAPEEGRG